MVDVTVDAKPKMQLPIDPDTIPDAVKKRAAAVDALYANGSLVVPQQSSEPAASEPPPPPAPPEPPRSLVEEPEPAPPLPVEEPPQRVSRETPPLEDENTESWKSRFLSMQGRYNSAQKTIGEMQEQMAQLGNEVMQLQQAVIQPPRAPPRPPAPPPVYVTPEDEQNYGRDLIDFTRRAATEVITPKLMEIEQQNAELQRRLAIEARRSMDQRVEQAVPNFREIDRDPRWHSWLRGVDLLSGRVRQQLLNEAIAAADAPRAISFFRGFQQEETATGHLEPAPVSRQAAPPREPAIPLASLAVPGRARPSTGGDASLPPEKPTYTRAQIAQLYSAHRKGAYVGREAEWARQDADIIAAGREGRIR
jgi:hypothetical protein